MLTWGNHWWSATGSLLHLGLREDDRWLACLPLFHVGGLSILWKSVLYGIPAVLHDSFDAQRVSEALDADAVTHLSLVATMLEQVLEARGDRPAPAALSCVLLGGGPASGSLLERCLSGGLPIAPSYGLTEAASQVATLAPGELSGKIGSSAKPLLPTEVRVAAEDGSPVPGADEGRILVRGPNLFQRNRFTSEQGQAASLLPGAAGSVQDTATAALRYEPAA